MKNVMPKLPSRLNDVATIERTYISIHIHPHILPNFKSVLADLILRIATCLNVVHVDVCIAIYTY